jgi:ABC-type uncharacterized transport system involved in gliding motility auxiliary subunit
MMKRLQARRLQGDRRRINPFQAGNVRLTALVLAVFVAGVGASALWFASRSKPASNGKAPLSHSTEAALQRLKKPVEIRFYSVLDPVAASESLTAYARRVENLLARYEQESQGRVKLKIVTAPDNQSAKAALADGIEPFSVGQTDTSYLGLVVVRDGQKESLPSLSPEWEQALEPDLTRALERLGAGEQPRPAAPLPEDAQLLQEARRAVPNLDSVSAQEGEKLLRQSALLELGQAAQEMQTKLKQAQDNYAKVQSGASPEELEVARKAVEQVQVEQTEKFKQIIARSTAQIEAVQRLKKAQSPTP